MIANKKSIIFGISIGLFILGISLLYVTSNTDTIYGQFFENEQNDSENNSTNLASLDEQYDSDNAYIVLTSQKFKKSSSDYRDLIGQVKNIGNGTAEWVKILMTFYDKNGDVLSTEFNYAEVKTLHPGQKSTFTKMISKDDIQGMDYYEIGLQWNNPDGTEGYIESAQIYKGK